MRIRQISLGRLVLATGFLGAALGAIAGAARLIVTPNPESIQIAVFALAIGPLLGAAVCAPFGWFRCRVGAYIGFYVGILAWAVAFVILFILGEL
jgi:hypothetical protein